LSDRARDRRGNTERENDRNRPRAQTGSEIDLKRELVDHVHRERQP